MVEIVVGVVVYLLIGLLFEVSGPPGDFDPWTLLLWPFGIDIRITYWTEIRRIKRKGAQQRAEVLAGRDRNLRLLSWINDSMGDTRVVVKDGDKITVWHGSGATWHSPDGEKASEWFADWLCDRMKEEK